MEVCRLCLVLITTPGEAKSLDGEDRDMVQVVAPEMNLELTKDPVMCETCRDHLQKLRHFRSSCQDVEDRILDYCEQNGISEGQTVDLRAVLKADLSGDVEMVSVGYDPDPGSSKDEEEGMLEDEEDDGFKQEELDIKPDIIDDDKDENADPNEVSTNQNVADTLATGMCGIEGEDDNRWSCDGKRLSHSMYNLFETDDDGDLDDICLELDGSDIGEDSSKRKAGTPPRKVFKSRRIDAECALEYEGSPLMPTEEVCDKTCHEKVTKWLGIAPKISQKTDPISEETTPATAVTEPAGPHQREKKAYRTHFCYYCGSLASHLSRHLMRKHSSEELVRNALSKAKEREKSREVPEDNIESCQKTQVVKDEMRLVVTDGAKGIPVNSITHDNDEISEANLGEIKIEEQAHELLESDKIDSVKDPDFDINEYLFDGERFSDGHSSDSSENNLAENDIYDVSLFKNIDASTKTSTKTTSRTENTIAKLITQKQKSKSSLVDRLKLRNIYKNKKIACRFCCEDICSSNFMRHLQRRHGTEKEVIDILSLPKNSRERKDAAARFRNDTNFEMYLAGVIRPNCEKISNDSNTNGIYYPCMYCKGIYRKKYLRRHAKRCLAKGSDKECRKFLSKSQTYTACQLDTTHVISQLDIREKVFAIMRPDAISFEAKKDLLIATYGDSYLKNLRKKRSVYACSNRMRELSRLLITYRDLTDEKDADFKSLIDPKRFDVVVTAVKKLSGYEPLKKSFKAPSLAVHLGTSLKLVCDELVRLIQKESRGFICTNKVGCNQWLENIQRFKKLVESRWNIEMSSLLNKDGSLGRLELFEKIRKLGDFKSFQMNKAPIAVRRSGKGAISETYTVCPHCKGMFLKPYLKNHVRKFCKFRTSESTNLSGASKVMMFDVHPKAGEFYKKYVLPHLRDEAFFTLAATDDTLVLYGNAMGNRYSTADKKQDRAIAQKVRYLCKIFLKMQELDTDLKEFRQLFEAKYYGKFVEVANILAGMEGDSCSRSAVVTALFNVMRQLTTIVRSEMYRLEKRDEYRKLKTYIDLLKNGQNIDLTKIATETAAQIPQEEMESLETIDKSTGKTVEEEDATTDDGMRCYSPIPVVKRLPLRSNARRTWTTPEKSKMRRCFEAHLNNKEIPSLAECQQIIFDNEELRERTAMQMQAWMRAEILRNSSGRQSRWTTPLKEKCREYFRRYYKGEGYTKYPSQKELIEACSNVGEFEGLTPNLMRSHLQHDMKYLSRKA